MIDPSPYRIVLASKSPRRHELLAGLEIPFEIRAKDTDESYPENLRGAEIAEFLALIKSEAFDAEIAKDEVIVTADTIVVLGDTVFNKPASEDEAVEMIAALTGNTHSVITGVALSDASRRRVFSETTEVTFGEVNPEEVRHYVHKYAPFDKAGAYGIQEWIGYVGIESIRGSFYNVMGFPTRRFYNELKLFLGRES